ncbi:cytochrome P450 [Conidiobolus coronatus NRRL 28638]|uniref:Cytochrome P450 n=1 Tax=Conidiobolus coronatus (strain ATCC 28846 / CBS 209.66 / NRRL 28638) TaxID=796925 RepID=A0A137P9B4_CONC2|nr:cytochrome P450 [Conidiobolus coronatus NRRL 28638]|eukprot:KXN71595.1 cytochrome P450 [Conidiobolus coronatus NRRL 28638]
MNCFLIPLLSIYSGYKLYKILKCPPELQNIPSLDLSTLLKISTTKDGFDEELKKHVGPLLDKYGIVKYFSHHGWSVIISDPQLTKLVFNNSDIFQKDTNSAINSNPHAVKFFGKQQIVNTNGEDWKRMRKLMNPIFHKTWPIDKLSSCARDLIDSWSLTSGENVEIHENIQKLTLDVLGQAVFNMDFECIKNPQSKLYNQYHEISTQLFANLSYLFFPVLDKLPYFKRPELYKQIDSYDEFVKQMVALKKEELIENPNLAGKDDLLSKMLLSSMQADDENSKMTEKEIIDNLKSFFIAGHDTTSNTLTATLYYLARYPEIQDKLRSEILQVMNNPQVLTNPTVDQLKQMEYLNLVIKESMRAMATVSVLERVCTSEFQLTDSIKLTKNTPVFLMMYQVHQNPRYFSNPEKFDPERFRDPASVESKNWQPFITGPRACIGMTLSLMEQRISLVLLLQKFKFYIKESNPDYKKLRLNSSGILRPRDLHLDFIKLI